jgi:serine/threonine-protein kinase
VLALLYAAVFFLAAVFPRFWMPAERARLLESPFTLAPDVVSILAAIAVAVVVQYRLLPPPAILKLGLVFQVASNYGIAAAEFLGRTFETRPDGPGMSWVATWTLLFTIVVPTPPRIALVAALASVSAVPVMGLIAVARNEVLQQLRPHELFFGLVFPYLLVAGMAYVGARVVYSLGKEVTRARELGSYKLVERLGAGGMGEVWRASHRFLARPAAVKLIRSTSPDGSVREVSDEARHRFEREAQAIARLRSPHTVTLFDFGVAHDGSFYYAMELLDGVDADTLVRRHGPMPAGRVIHVLRQVCHSLSEAESCGLVHRDIKPSNIFLCRYGEDVDFVKVLDFGLVKTVSDATETGVILTREMTVHGTPAFIAPEQALGAAAIDGRADIYATGCVGYWLLTGQHVFRGETVLAVLAHHARTPAPAPSFSAPQPIPEKLDRIILDCLAKDPASRPQTARQLSRRLSELAALVPWTDDDARAWWTHALTGR